MNLRQIARTPIALLSRRVRLTVFVLAAITLPLALAAPSALAKSAPLTVSGRLDKAGYTVVAVSYNGKITSTHKQSFKLRLQEKKVTLQLIGPRGKYAGPIVVGYTKGKAIVGVRAGAKLGTIKVLRIKGYARVAKKIRASWVDSKRTALVRKQVPIGNGRNYGFVRSSRHNGSSGDGGDTDLDGVPNVLDAAASGSRVLNSLSADSGPAPGPPSPAPLANLFALEMAPEPGPGPGAPDPRWMSQIFLDIPHTLNANAAGVTRAQIDEMLVTNLDAVLLGVPQGDVVKLDCHGLIYCSLNGTGKTEARIPSLTDPSGTESVFTPFPDAAGDGLGILRGAGAPLLEGGNDFRFYPSTNSAKIGTGDMMTAVVENDGVTTLVPVPLDFVFNTVPATQSYDDGVGNSATISYPASENAVGTPRNPAPVSAGSDGHIKIHFTWWRPQRSGIVGAGEPTFMDVGRLVYAFNMPSGDLIPNPGADGSSPACSAASVTTSNPSLTLLSQPDGSGIPSGGLRDGSADIAANSVNTLSATLDVTRCIKDKGGPEVLPNDSRIHMDISANTQGSSDHANQDLFFRVVS